MDAINLAMEPEEKTILENVLSLVQQLLSMQGGMGQPEEAITEAMPPETPEELTGKAMTEETGDDKAEDRLNNQTDVTDESMTDLKKNLEMLTSILGRKTTVQKSRTNDPVLAELRKLNGTLQDVIKTQQAQDEFNHTLMQAVGFSDEMVTKTLESTKQPVNQNKPFQGQDMALFAQEFAKCYAIEVAKTMQNQPQFQTNNHPFNQRKYDNQKPMNNVIDFVCNSAKKLSEFTYLGWDIALTNDGPLAIETNLFFGLDGLQMLAGGLREQFNIDDPDYYWKNKGKRA